MSWNEIFGDQMNKNLRVILGSKNSIQNQLTGQ